MARAENRALEALKRMHVPPAPPGPRPDPGAHRGEPSGLASAPGWVPASRRVPGAAQGRGTAVADRYPASTLDRVPPGVEPPPPAPADGRGAEAEARRRRAVARADEGVEANARLTGMTAAVLLVLLAAEGLTVLQIHSLLTPHVFIGMLLVPVVLVKMGSTGWRFARYYLGSPAYRRRGAPLPLLRLLGPVVVILTVVLFASGIALLLTTGSGQAALLRIHQVSFVLWFIAMAVHVLGHILETAKLAPADWARRSRRQVRGASGRQWLLALSLVVGVFLAVEMLPKVGPWVVAFTGHR